jgi:hypothetical protein
MQLLRQKKSEDIIILHDKIEENISKKDLAGNV